MGRASTPFWLALGLLLPALVLTRLPLRARGEALPAPLASFPAALGDWQAAAVADWQAPERPATASSMLFRTYRDPQGGVVALSVIYWKAQAPGHVAFTEKYAAPGADWTYVRQQYDRIASAPASGPDLTVTRALFERQGEDALVSYWFVQPGRRIVASRYWGRAYMLWDYLTRFRSDVAVVRVITRGVGAATWDTFPLHEAFIRAALPTLDRYLPG